MKALKKLTCITVTVLAMSSGALAAPDLGGVMKHMSSLLKQILAQAGDSSMNAESARLCDQLIAEIESSKDFTPKRVANLPPNQQDAQQAAYVKVLTKLASKVKELKTDFAKNDNAAAAGALNEIAALRGIGHKQFK